MRWNSGRRTITHLRRRRERKKGRTKRRKIH
jgi:hypothetical protein